MKKVFGAATLIAALAAVSCSNPALRESPAPQAERKVDIRKYTVAGFDKDGTRNGTVVFRAIRHWTTEDGYLAFAFDKCPSVYEGDLVNLADVETMKLDFGKYGARYSAAGERFLLYWYARGMDYAIRDGESYVLYLSTLHYERINALHDLFH